MAQDSYPVCTLPFPVLGYQCLQQRYLSLFLKMLILQCHEFLTAAAESNACEPRAAGAPGGLRPGLGELTAACWAQQGRSLYLGPHPKDTWQGPSWQWSSKSLDFWGQTFC